MGSHSRAVVVLLALCAATLSAQGAATPVVAPGAARTLSGLGTPITLGIPCDATLSSAGAATLFFDTLPADVGKRTWLCSTNDGSTFAWANFPASISVTILAPVTATLALAGGTYSGTVANSFAAVGMTARIEPIAVDPGLVFYSAWVQTNGVVNYRFTNLSAANSTLNAISWAIYLSKP